MDEIPENRLKRLAMRSHRRGTKEMDLILGRYADDRLRSMDSAGLDVYEALLEENDQDLYQWVTGQVAPPHRFQDIVETVARHASVMR